MRKLARWFSMFRITLKRAFCRPLFIIFLLAFPMGMAALHHIENDDSSRISVALYTGKDIWNQKIAENLEADEGSFDFYTCDTQEQAENDVMTKKAECAYIFPYNLKECLDSEDYSRVITVLISPSTVAEKIASEKVFSVIFEEYGREMLESYAKNGSAFQNAMKLLTTAQEQENVCEEILNLYDKYKNNGSTFSFDYKSLQGNTSEESVSLKVVFPVRGIVAIFIFIMGLAAAVMAGEDEKNGLYAAVRSKEKWILQSSQIASFVFMAEVSGFLALCITGNILEPFVEAEKMICYLLAVTVYSFMCLLIFRKPGLVAALIPFFIVGCILICPVFFDISIFLPEFSVIRRLLPPWWYLKLA